MSSTGERWGVDFGNVIVKNIERKVREELGESFKPNEDKFTDPYWLKLVDSFLERHSILIPNALEGLKRLIEEYGVTNVWIVSRASRIESLFNRRLMQVHDIYNKTQLCHSQVIFVPRYPDKAEVCGRYRINNHIDDHGEVLYHLQDTVPSLIWFNPPKIDVELWGHRFTNRPRQVGGWEEILAE